MRVHHWFHRLIAAVAVAAPAADVLGRLLAPSLITTWPVLIVALSPADPHLLLATNESRIVLAGIAFTTRLGRAWAIFHSAGRLAERGRNGRLGWVVASRATARRAIPTGIGAVLLLPGMAGAVVAARARLRAGLYIALASCSTAAGLALTLTAAHLFDEQLASVSGTLTRNPLPTTGIVALLVVIGFAHGRRTHLRHAQPRALTDRPLHARAPRPARQSSR